MKKLLVAFLFALSPVIAHAAGHGSTGGAIPVLTPGSGWAGASTAQPADVGGSSDDAIAVWDMVPYSLQSGTFYICVDAFHQKGIDHVTIAADNGSFITALSTTAHEGTVAEYCVLGQDTAFNDGQHELRAIVYPTQGVARVLQSTATVTANTTNTFTHEAHGQFTNKGFTTSGGSCAGLTDGTTYYILAAGLTQGTYEIATTKAGTPIVASGSCTFTITYLNASTIEQYLTMGESMFIMTNGHSNIVNNSVYVDSVNGNDSNNCLTSGAPCLTIHQARLDILSPENGLTQTVGNVASCSTFTRSGNTGGISYTVGSPVIYNTSGTADAPFVGGTLYWVISNTGNVVELSATPGGSCVNGSGGSGNRSLNTDGGGDNIYLMCSSPCSSPSEYSYGGATENSVLQTLQTYLNVAPAPGTLASNTAIACSGSSNGIRTYKAHITTSVNTIAGTSGCSPTTGQLVLGGNGYDIWLDVVTLVGPGSYINGAGPIGVPSGSMTYSTNSNFSLYQNALYPSTFSYKDTVLNVGQVAFNNGTVVIGSTASNVGLDQNDPVTSNADSPSGQKVVNFAASGLPANIQVANGDGGWILYGPACITGSVNGGSAITAFDNSAATVTITANLNSDCPNGTLFALGTNFHPDFNFTVNGGNNQVIYGATGTSGITAEGYFTQNPLNFDFAAINNTITSSNINSFSGFTTILLEGGVTNMLVQGNTFGGSANFTTASPTFTDVLFLNNTCSGGAFITSAASGVTGITVTGGSC